MFSRISSTYLLSLATLLTSCGVALLVNNSLTENVKIIDLAVWGGVSWNTLIDGEFWRLITAQLVHVKLPHMLFNVCCLFLIGRIVEKTAGNLAVLSVWLLGGGIATVFSPIFIEPPYNIGTGASHAVLALGGFMLIYLIKRKIKNAYFNSIVFLALLPPFLIDFAFAGYPKIGHIIGLILGLFMGLLWSSDK